jgi:RNA polymerase sigma-70 factor (ECF subfamily)
MTSFDPQSRHDPYAAFRGFLRKRLPDPETADDILQQNLLKAFQDGSWDEKENPSAWFHRVLKNAVADFYRARAARERKEERHAATELVPEASDDAYREEACECFRALLPGLKPEYADALKMVDLEGRKPREAAELSGISVENMNVRLHRARRALRKKLEENCGMCSVHGCLNCACGHRENDGHGFDRG